MGEVKINLSSAVKGNKSMHKWVPLYLNGKEEGAIRLKIEAKDF